MLLEIEDNIGSWELELDFVLENIELKYGFVCHATDVCKFIS